MKRTSRDIRVANRFEVLRRILAGGPVSRQEVAADTGLSLATVSNLVGELLQVGLLEEVGYQDSGGGRPRALLAVHRPGGFLAGVDVAETYVHVELFDTGLQVLASVDRMFARVCRSAIRDAATPSSAERRAPSPAIAFLRSASPRHVPWRAALG